MSTGPFENVAALERSLASITTGPEGAADLWQRALDARGASDAPRSRSIWTQNLNSTWLAVAACIVLVIGIGAILMPSLGKARSSARMATMSSNEDGVGRIQSAMVTSAGSSALERAGTEVVVDSPHAMRDPPAEYQDRSVSRSVALPSLDRFVIRKASLDLATVEVRGAFAKTGLVVNEALGEYIESSSLTGEGASAFATVTVRVGTGRLSEVLNQLRILGTVVSETSTGQDVTETAVDLEARIRNEQRIEQELLALIDKRPDAPLKDLLEIRAQLAGIRGQIESLVGQRERLGRLVSLATVLVTIRGKDAPILAEAAGGIGDYFVSSIDEAWHTALRALSDTAAFLIRIIVGGIVWWLLAIIAGAAAIKASRRALAKRATEPAPVG